MVINKLTNELSNLLHISLNFHSHYHSHRVNRSQNQVLREITGTQFSPEHRCTCDRSVLIEDDPSIATYDPIDRRDTRQFVRWTNAFFLETFANLPGKDLRIIAFVFSDTLDDIRRGHFRFRATN